MVLRNAFKTGRCLVVAIPKKYAEALRIVPGTPLCVSLSNRTLLISRGVITPESMHAPGSVEPSPADPTKGSR